MHAQTAPGSLTGILRPLAFAGRGLGSRRVRCRGLLQALTGKHGIAHTIEGEGDGLRDAVVSLRQQVLKVAAVGAGAVRGADLARVGLVAAAAARVLGSINTKRCA
jgi:hypothetical protein